MKFDFTRMTVATSVTVALTCLGNVAWADCYQDGYNDGQKACPACPPLPNCQEGDYDKGFQEGKDKGLQDGYDNGQKACPACPPLPNCQEGDYDKGFQEGKNFVQLPNCKEGDYANGYQAGVGSVGCTEGDYDRGLQEGKDSVSCQTEYDKGLQEGRDSISCQTEYDRGLQEGRNSVSCQTEYDNGKQKATLSYTGYVDTTTSTPTAKSCQENPGHKECQSPKGFTEGYDEGVKWATAQYTGYVDEAQTPSVPKSCSEADANDQECSSKQEGFKEGYAKGLATAKANEGEVSGTEPNAHQSYTGYVDETGVAHSCQEVQEDSKADPATKEAKCANQDGFEKGFDQGFDLGQLSLAGYVETDKDGKKVPKSCQEDDENDACEQGTLQGFTDGYTLGQQNANSTATEPPLLSGEDLTKCQETPSECSNKVFTQGYKAGQNIINYLQGFYNYFVQKRLQDVTDNEKIFPASLIVQPFGGPDSNTPADQWRYTWKNRNKTQDCETISGDKSKPFDPEGDHQAISLCIEQTKDMNAETDPEKPGFGGSKDTSALTSEQSLGYTVYLLDPREPDEKKKVKATMEIIFSPNEEASPAEGNASETGTTATEVKPVEGDGKTDEGDTTETDGNPVNTTEKPTGEGTTATDEESTSAKEEDTTATGENPVTPPADKEENNEKTTLPEPVGTDTGATTSTDAASSDKTTP